ncbi:MAG: hypothetical protein KDC05_10205 [Bacteroidales bacterium]|nr:hypothetical protein [Bacteroidales bacterium]
MKQIFFTICISLLFSLVNGQSFYSLDYTISFGNDETADYIQSPSFRGVTFEGRGFVSDNVSLGGLFTWSTFYEELAGATFSEDNLTLTGTQYRYLNAFPILFQAHYYLGDDEYEPRAFLGGGAGAYKMVQRTNVGILSLEHNNWHFGFSPEVGIMFPVSMGTSIIVGFRYHYVVKAKDTMNFSWFALNLGLAWDNY